MGGTLSFVFVIFAGVLGCLHVEMPKEFYRILFCLHGHGHGSAGVRCVGGGDVHLPIDGRMDGCIAAQNSMKRPKA